MRDWLDQLGTAATGGLDLAERGVKRGVELAQQGLGLGRQGLETLGLAQPQQPPGMFGAPSQYRPTDFSDLTTLQQLMMRAQNMLAAGTGEPLVSRRIAQGRATGNEQRIKAFETGRKMLADFNEIRGKATPEDFPRINALLKKTFAERAGGAPGEADEFYEALMGAGVGNTAGLLELLKDDPGAQQMIRMGAGVGDLAKYGLDKTKEGIIFGDDAKITPIRAKLQALLNNEGVTPEERMQLDKLRDPQGGGLTLDAVLQVLGDRLSGEEQQIAKRHEPEFADIGLQTPKERAGHREALIKHNLEMQLEGAKAAGRASAAWPGDAAYGEQMSAYIASPEMRAEDRPIAPPDVNPVTIQRWNQILQRERERRATAAAAATKEGKEEASKSAGDAYAAAVVAALAENKPPPPPPAGVPSDVLDRMQKLIETRQAREAKDNPDTRAYTAAANSYVLGDQTGPPPVPGPGVPTSEITRQGMRIAAAAEARARRMGNPADGPYTADLQAWIASGAVGPPPKPPPGVSQDALDDGTARIQTALRAKQAAGGSNAGQRVFSSTVRKEVRPFREQIGQLNQLLAAPYNTAGSYEVLNGWISKIDNTAAREGEVRVVRESQALTAQIRLMIQRFAKGGVVDEQTFNEIKGRIAASKDRIDRMYRTSIADEVRIGQQLYKDNPDIVDGLIPQWRDTLQGADKYQTSTGGESLNSIGADLLGEPGGQGTAAPGGAAGAEKPPRPAGAGPNAVLKRHPTRGWMWLEPVDPNDPKSQLRPVQ